MTLEPNRSSRGDMETVPFVGGFHGAWGRKNTKLIKNVVQGDKTNACDRNSRRSSSFPKHIETMPEFKKITEIGRRTSNIG